MNVLGYPVHKPLAIWALILIHFSKMSGIVRCFSLFDKYTILVFFFYKHILDENVFSLISKQNGKMFSFYWGVRSQYKNKMVFPFGSQVT